jgi:hypothetical protein
VRGLAELPIGAVVVGLVQDSLVQRKATPIIAHTHALPCLILSIY